MRLSIAAALTAIPSLAFSQLLPSATRERCEAAPAATPSAQAWLDRAAASVLPADPTAHVLQYRASHDVPAWEQSDRMYPPFISRAPSTDRWIDLATRVEARQPIDRPATVGRYPLQIITPTMLVGGADTTVRPPAALSEAMKTQRLENAWLVLAEWRDSAAATRVSGRCYYRDAWRVVLERGPEKLYLSESDGVPVKLDRVEPHYLWGQVRAEYLWSTWWGVNGGGYFPLSSFRIFDGSVYERVGALSVAGITGGSVRLVSRDSAPRLSVPANLVAPPPRPGPIMTPDTVRIADNTYLLVTPSYTETVALRRDTVFLLDATSGEARSRADSAMIAALFPGRHPVVVVVTDLAWPHISGVRFWVARGATIISHEASRDFLTRVTDRKWTLAPDALEATKPRRTMRFRAVTDSLKPAGGDLVIHALRGTSTELALGVWMPGVRYFWAGDYVQATDGSPYSRDVVNTINALGLKPLKVGAQHIRLTNWTDLEARVKR
jgi:hypothetical protein